LFVFIYSTTVPENESRASKNTQLFVIKHNKKLSLTVPPKLLREFITNMKYIFKIFIYKIT